MSSPDFDLSPPTPEQRRALEAALTRQERDVLLNHGTEQPFCGVLLKNKKSGVYCCKLCGLPLFMANQKFESGTVCGKTPDDGQRQHLWHATYRDSLRTMRKPSRARISGRSAPYAPALLHQLRFIGFRRRRRKIAGQARSRREIQSNRLRRRRAPGGFIPPNRQVVANRSRPSSAAQKLASGLASIASLAPIRFRSCPPCKGAER